jgi:hypothetical protein
VPFGQPHFAAELVDARRNPQVVGGDNRFGDDRRTRRAPEHMFDHRSSVQIRERFAGKPCRSVSGGDDGDDLERIV